MIDFFNIKNTSPLNILKQKYEKALAANQKNIEAIVISSYNIKKKQVDSRCVNLKWINDEDLVFFSNYESNKSIQFKKHNQIAALIFWSSINTQIRIKATIKKTPIDLNNEYFKKRSKAKNALAISSNQSKIISSFDDVKKKYEYALENANLSECPSYWGGFQFKPYEIEFWEGHKARLNKRDVFLLNGDEWIHNILEP